MSYNHISQLSAPQKTRKQHNYKVKVVRTRFRMSNLWILSCQGWLRPRMCKVQLKMRDLHLQYKMYIFNVPPQYRLSVQCVLHLVRYNLKIVPHAFISHFRFPLKPFSIFARFRLNLGEN
jgi:hypothetical protein